MSSDGTGVVNLTNTSNSDEFSPAWSPDGQSIAFIRRVVTPVYTTDIYVMNADGTAATKLTNNDVPNAALLDWSPGGQYIAFSCACREFFDELGQHFNKEIFKIDVITGEKIRLTDSPWTLSGQDLYPKWSPDGQRIAFERLHATEENWEIYVMNADGSDLTRLTDNPHQDSHPAWSPDGRHIVFFSVREEGQGFYLMNADGTQVERLGEFPGQYDLDWSPDGKYIVFAGGFRSPPEIWVMRADGTRQLQLTNGFEIASYPVWEPVRSREG